MSWFSSPTQNRAGSLQFPSFLRPERCRPTAGLRTERPLAPPVEAVDRDPEDSRVAPGRARPPKEIGRARTWGTCSLEVLVAERGSLAGEASDASGGNGQGRDRTPGLPDWVPLAGRGAVRAHTEVPTPAVDVLVLLSPVAEEELQSPGAPELRRERKGPPQCAFD